MNVQYVCNIYLTNESFLSRLQVGHRYWLPIKTAIIRFPRASSFATAKDAYLERNVLLNFQKRDISDFFRARIICF